MKAMIVVGLFAATMASSASAADDADQHADIRCFIGMATMAKNETYKQWGTFGMFFYAGRIKGRDAKLDMAEALKREIPMMRGYPINDEIKRCSDQLGQVSRDLEALKRDAPRGVGR